MEGSYSDKYGFIGEWYDNQASQIRTFNIFYYPVDKSVEIYDRKLHKKFMKRIKMEDLSIQEFYIGGTVYLMGRLIKITNYACENTKLKLEKDLEVTFAVLKPGAGDEVSGKILRHFHEAGLKVTRMKKVQLTSDDIASIYRHMLQDPVFAFLRSFLNGNHVYGLELVGRDAVQTVLKLLGSNEPHEAAPGTIRAMYGIDSVRNCVDAAPSGELALEYLNYFFPPSDLGITRLSLTPTLSNCTLSIIKPHALKAGNLGPIMTAICEGGFLITALNMMIVENINCAEFLEVYKGLVPEYQGMVEELASGQCVAMEIVAKDSSKNTAVEFRKLVGPVDPEIARMLRPNSLRARFGVSKIQNAVHCSDLPEDGLLEVEYFFKILAI